MVEANIPAEPSEVESRAYHAEYMREWRARNREEQREWWREYHAKHREKRNAEKRRRWHARADAINEKRREEHKRDPSAKRASDRAYYERNRERLKARQKVYYEANKPKVLASIARYKAAHPEEVKAWMRARKLRRRAREAGAEGEFTQAEWLALCARFGHRCAICRRRRKLDADHIIPISKGGSNWISNIQPLCHSCNASKADKIPAGPTETAFALRSP